MTLANQGIACWYMSMGDLSFIRRDFLLVFPDVLEYWASYLSHALCVQPAAVGYYADVFFICCNNSGSFGLMRQTDTIGYRVCVCVCPS